MAEQEEHSMIGYDPLAWLSESKQTENAESDRFTASGSASEDESCAEAALITEPGNDDSGTTTSSDLALEQDETTDEPLSASKTANLGVETADWQDVDTIADWVEDASNSFGSVAAGGQVVLEPVQTIQNVGELHQQLRELLDTGDKIDIDASAVAQIDTATLQLLLVLKLTAVKLQKEVSIDFPSERFLEAAQLLGIAEMLSVAQAASGFF